MSPITVTDNMVSSGQASAVMNSVCDKEARASCVAGCRFRKVVAGPQKGLRHKWLRLNSEGDALVLNAGKHHLTARLGVQVPLLHNDPQRHAVLVSE